jgi:fatty-acid desaturase
MDSHPDTPGVLEMPVAAPPGKGKRRRPDRSKGRKRKSAGRPAAAVNPADEAAAAVIAPPTSSGEVLHEADVRWEKGVDWPIVLWVVGTHLGLLAAPFFFTWKAVLLVLFLGWLTGGVGVCLGYHRQLTHGSFMTYRPIRWLLALLGSLSGEGSAITWVANHRKHHAHSDKPGDPHSPRDGKWWAHMLWFMPNFGHTWREELTDRYVPDLKRDPVMRFLDKTFLLWHFALAGLLYAVGYVFWDTYTAWSFVIYGMFVRMVYVLHVTWFVNSATHIWGYRNYETSDDSTNLWWVGLLAYGEGWHNNHHAYQRLAPHGHKWWEIDMTYWLICAMEKVGLAWNVVRKIPPNQKPA